MDLVPKASIKCLSLGDVLTGQDGNKYIVCDEGGIIYWKPHVTSVASVQVITPTKPIKEVKEKYYWKDNDKKPCYDGPSRYEMEESLKPKVSPTKFPAGYVWTTKFSDISFVVDTEYKGYSKTSTRFWQTVSTCPPCLNAEDYPYEYISGGYCVVYDEQGNKFWTGTSGDGEFYPLQYARKFPEGHIYTTSDGSKFKTTAFDDGDAYWKDDE